MIVWDGLRPDPIVFFAKEKRKEKIRKSLSSAPMSIDVMPLWNQAEAATTLSSPIQIKAPRSFLSKQMRKLAWKVIRWTA